ncbi:MAG: PQQ-binding-like beta-propeller repeat protein [Cyanobacteria bacterium J06621_8]
MIKVNWQFGDSTTLAKYNGSPIIDQESIYISAGNFNNPILYSINAQTGKEQWHYSFDNRDCDIYASPKIYGNNIYVSSVRGKLLSLDASSGSLNWEAEIEKSISLSPLKSSVIIVDKILYVGSNNGYLCSFDADTGEELDKIKVIDNRAVNTPVYANDQKTICVETSDGSVHAVDLNTQEVRWRYFDGDPTLNFYGFPVVNNGIVYSGGGSTNFAALDLESGDKIWNFKPKSVQAFTSPAVADGIVCFANYNGMIWGANCNDGQILWSYKTITTLKNVAFGWLSTPVISEQKVFLGGRGYLRSLELQTGKEIWKYAAPCSENIIFEPMNLIFETFNQIGKLLIDNTFSAFYDPLVKDNLIYIVAKNGSFHRLLSLTVETMVRTKFE